MGDCVMLYYRYVNLEEEGLCTNTAASPLQGWRCLFLGSLKTE